MFKVWNSQLKKFQFYVVSQPFELSGLKVVFIGSEPEQTIYLADESEMMEVIEVLQPILKGEKM